MNKHILIADDETHIRVLMEQTLEELEEESIELLLASDGAQALDLIRQTKPELIFLDVMMPKMNGFEVCQTIRSDPELQHLHVIMLTAKGQEFDQRKGKEVGADRYITKPFDPDEIIHTARTILIPNSIL